MPEVDSGVVLMSWYTSIYCCIGIDQHEPELWSSPLKLPGMHAID